MLTRLKIKGFKNLVDVEVQLGPVTCIAGPNGVGKSNLFDAIHFLALLASKPFNETANEIRGGTRLRDLFTVGGNDHIEFECDVLIPPTGTDDFGQPATALHTHLTYHLSLGYEAPQGSTPPRVRLKRETLTARPPKGRLGFEHSDEWTKTAVFGADDDYPTNLIDTEGDRIFMPLEPRDEGGGQSGISIEFSAARLPRTVLSSATNASGSPTAALLRREMLSWRLLGLELSALRSSDGLHEPAQLSSSGHHMPATLYRIARDNDESAVYAEITNRLSELIDVRGIRVDRDEQRDRLSLALIEPNGTEVFASSLSDGTLRMLALTLLEQDLGWRGLVCLEEPENGIHPRCIEPLLRLFEDMAVDPREPVDATNPLRQVLLTTHSPLLVARQRAANVLFATPVPQRCGESIIRGVRFRGAAGTWRDENSESMSRGAMLGYLDPQGANEGSDEGPASSGPSLRQLLSSGSRSP